jgi:hypothetical protein
VLLRPALLAWFCEQVNTQDDLHQVSNTGSASGFTAYFARQQMLIARNVTKITVLLCVSDKIASIGALGSPSYAG